MLWRVGSVKRSCPPGLSTDSRRCRCPVGPHGTGRGGVGLSVRHTAHGTVYCIEQSAARVGRRHLAVRLSTHATSFVEKTRRKRARRGPLCKTAVPGVDPIPARFPGGGRSGKCEDTVTRVASQSGLSVSRQTKYYKIEAKAHVRCATNGHGPACSRATPGGGDSARSRYPPTRAHQIAGRPRHRPARRVLDVTPRETLFRRHKLKSTGQIHVRA